MASYTTLPLNNAPGCCLLRKPDAAISSLGHDSPALTLMTDFEDRSPLSVAATTNIDKALDYMMISRVRLLFVIDSEYILLGSITSYDIQGENPCFTCNPRIAASVFARDRISRHHDSGFEMEDAPL